MRHQLGDVLDVVAQRRHLDGAREQREQVGEVAVAVAPLLPMVATTQCPSDVGRLAVRLEHVDQHAPCASGGSRSRWVSTSVPPPVASSSMTSAIQRGP